MDGIVIVMILIVLFCYWFLSIFSISKIRTIIACSVLAVIYTILYIAWG
jgi:hypothetical protein